MLMYSALDFEREKKRLLEHGRDFRSRDELLEELKAEWHNMILFASYEAIREVFLFIQAPNVKFFRTAVIAMRSDLWGGKISPALRNLDLCEFMK